MKYLREAGHRRPVAEHVDLRRREVGLLYHVAALHFREAEARSVEADALLHDALQCIVLERESDVVQPSDKVDGFEIEKFRVVFVDKVLDAR